MSNLQQWFDHYSNDHRDPTNRAIHWVCVPLIVWSVIAALWCVPAPASLFKPGIWSAVAMLLATLFYYRGSRAIGFGMLLFFAALTFITSQLYATLGAKPLLYLAIGVFAVAWIGQFIGHRIEGRKPSFLTDIKYLLIGPAWLMSKAFNRFGWKY